ncbi:MAG: hypothetical protein HY072_07065 [Deltaproteobacteria bacterium]|nr:hypothetical protein [Deltaproteobacteria bacterium]
MNKSAILLKVKNLLQRRSHNGLSEKEIGFLASLIGSPMLPDVVPIVFEASKKLRNEIFQNTVTLMAPIELSSYCASNCSFCGWRSTNKNIPRARQNMKSFEMEVQEVLSKGVSHIELASGDDLFFIREHLPCYIRKIHQLANDLGSQLIRVSVCITPLLEKHYKELCKNGLSCVLTWQETYNRSRYFQTIISGPKRYGITKNLKANTSGDGYMFRITSQENALLAGMQVGVGALLDQNSDIACEVVATILHARMLLNHYPNAQPIIFGMPIMQNAVGIKSVFNEDFWDIHFPFIACLYLLSMPNGKAWVFSNCRVKLDTQIQSVSLASNFTSTEVRLTPGGYTKSNLIDGNMKSLEQVSGSIENNVSILQGEQFAHYFYPHHEYISEMKNLGIDTNTSMPTNRRKDHVDCCITRR